MKRQPENWPVYSLNSYQNQIDPKPPYQRGPVWSTSHQQLFIDSILRGFDIPKLYIRSVNASDYTWEVVDGQQRLRAIWDFYSNRFALSTDSDPIGDQSISGLYHRDLHPDLLGTLDTYQLSIVILNDANDTEVEDMFIRLQNGVPLNSAEKRHAISGTMRDFIHNLANNHPLMTTSAGYPNKRYAHDEAVAQMMLIELQRGPTKLRHNQLKQLYENNRSFSTSSREAAMLKKTMNFLHSSFPERTPELNKVNLLSLYTLASGALRTFALYERAEEFGEWFRDFEDRRHVDDDRSEDNRSDDLLSYQIAITGGSADPASQHERQRILASGMAATIRDLAPIDQRRLFTAEQRQAIFRLSEKKCANPDGNPDCEVECGWDDFHADHVVPHSKGGPTTVANGQLLCSSCNQKKGASGS